MSRIESEVLPVFKGWIDSIPYEVPKKDWKSYGRFFLAKHLRPEVAETRGAIYDIFEKFEEYVDIQYHLYANQMPEETKKNLKNMAGIAKGIVWAIQHDAFDDIKYEPFTKYGKDIMMYTHEDAPVKYRSV